MNRNCRSDGATMKHFSLSDEGGSGECIHRNIFPPPANGSATTTEDQVSAVVQEGMHPLL